MLEHDVSLLEQDARLLEHDAMLVEHDAMFVEHDGMSVEHDRMLVEHDGMLVEHDGIVLDQETGMRDQVPLDELIKLARVRLGATQLTFGKQLGVHAQTISRWEFGRALPMHEHLQTMVRLVHPKDRELAALLAGRIGQNLHGLGLEPAVTPAQPVGVHAKRAADAVLCAAAESIDLSPVRLRGALLAAVEEAVAAGLTLEALRDGLRPSKAKK